MTATVRGVSVNGREGSFNDELKSEYKVVYFVTTDDVSDGPYQVRTASGIPALGDVYQVGNDFDPQAICVEKTATQRDSPSEWEVEVRYSTVVADRPDPSETNPLDEPPEISFGFQTRQKVIPGYFNDPLNPDSQKNLDVGIVNSAGELFDPQPEMEVADPVMTIKRNLANLNLSLFLSVANTVNYTYYYGCEPRTLRLLPPTATRMYDSAVGYYWACTFEFVYRYETWDLQLLNVGSYYIDGTTRKKFQMADGTPFVGLLKATGTAINVTDEDELGRYVSGGDAPSFQRLRIFREIDFNSLGII